MLIDLGWFSFDLFQITYDGVLLAVGGTAILAALGVVLCSSPIYSALYLIGHMICLAILFLMYGAEFIAAVQLIVYAGAVMILFLFIIALLGGKKESQSFDFHKFMALSFIGTVLAELALSARVGPTRPVTGIFDEKLIADVGNAKAIGLELYSKHLIPFELASCLLLVAGVGIICLSKFTYKPPQRRSN